MTEQLLHLTEEPLWEAARTAGTYDIHCSLPHQLPAVARAVYGSDTGNLVVLVIDTGRVPAPVRYEAMEPGGEEFPHIYGPLPTDAVVEVRPWAGQATRAADEQGGTP
ncbi:DUF952 domain-containing protein [Streptomyces sp. NPDC047804]|uniref:DUF952 domain-containing protein n=1 Tax=Streptomyces sp. NPDC047804 TaxID=3156663 RepID=UPI0033E10A37